MFSRKLPIHANMTQNNSIYNIFKKLKYETNRIKILRWIPNIEEKLENNEKEKCYLESYYNTTTTMILAYLTVCSAQGLTRLQWKVHSRLQYHLSLRILCQGHLDCWQNSVTQSRKSEVSIFWQAIGWDCCQF